MPRTLDDVVMAVKPVLPHTARILADRLLRFVRSTTKRLAARLGA